jgi:hypothetical protein
MQTVLSPCEACAIEHGAAPPSVVIVLVAPRSSSVPPHVRGVLSLDVRMRRRVLGSALLFLAVLTGSAGLAPAASAAVGPNTTWAMASDPGDYILAGEQYAYDASSGMQLQGTAARIEGTVDGWRLSVEPADGDVLAAGRTYAGATRTPLHAGNVPGLELIGNGRGCNTLTGTFTIPELTFDLGGNLESLVLTFEQHCEGNAPAAYGSIAWHASTAAPPVPPKLTMKMNEKHVAYGKKVTVEAQLSGESANREVSVYARLSDGKEQLLTRASVDAAGHLAVRVKLTETATIIARLSGNGAFPDREAGQDVIVSGKLRSAFLDKAPHSGKFHLYRYTKDATVGSLLLPNHKGDCLSFRLQLQARGSWGYDTVTKCLKLNKNSAVGVRVPGDPRAVGIPIRIRSEWKGDDRNAKANGKWLYLKFVAGGRVAATTSDRQLYEAGEMLLLRRNRLFGS